MPKGAAITLSTNIDMQQSNAMHYKATDETAKFEQVGTQSTAAACCCCHDSCHGKPPVWACTTAQSRWV
jgi:hypothetical protein